VDTHDEARLLCPTVKRIQESLPAEKNVIQSCMSLFGLIPEFPKDPEAHQSALRQVQQSLGHHLLKYSDRSDIFEAMRKNTSLTPPLFENIPDQIKRRYTEKNGEIGLFAFINPDNSKPLQDGVNLLNFTESLTEFELGTTDKVVSASGESFVLADLLRNIHSEGPRVSALAFAGVILIAVFLSGGLRAGLLMSFCLGLATWWMWGIQGFWDIKYNFFNFIALPLTFGIGVDYPINVYIRCRQEKFKNFGKIFASTGLAVALCSTTTIIGYYTLLGASSQALASFGKISIIGEVTCLIAALLVVPVALRLAGYFSESRKL
jgi:predicted RND superfamily exporter protein